MFIFSQYIDIICYVKRLRKIKLYIIKCNLLFYRASTNLSVKRYWEFIVVSKNFSNENILISSKSFHNHWCFQKCFKCDLVTYSSGPITYQTYIPSMMYPCFCSSAQLSIFWWIVTEFGTNDLRGLLMCLFIFVVYLSYCTKFDHVWCSWFCVSLQEISWELLDEFFINLVWFIITTFML